MGRDILVLHVTTDVPSSTSLAAQIESVTDDITVATASTAADAIEHSRTTPVDCVICDTTVGSVSGLELCRRLRDDQPTVPFVLVLDSDAELSPNEAFAAGATDCLLASSLRGDVDLAEIKLVVARIRKAIDDATGTQSTPTHAPSADKIEARTKTADYRSLIEDVLNVSYVGTFVLDSDCLVVWINDSIEEYFGVDRSTVVGRDKRELLTDEIKHIFADPDRFAEKVLATYDDNSYIEQFECHVLPAGGREDRWLEHRSYPITRGPYTGGRIEHYVDITARKHRQQELESERQLLERLFETNPVGIALLDADGRITRANKHGERVLGLSQSTLETRSYDDPDWQIHDEAGEAILSDELPFARVQRTGKPVFDHEHGITLADGSTRWLSVSAAPLTTEDEAVEQVICVVTDMTAIRDSECALARQNERLTEFANIVSHDLRNPLNVLVGSLELAAETGEMAHFKRCNRAVNRMSQLIDDLLSLAHDGEEIDHTEPVDLGALASECWHHLSTESATLQVETNQQITADRSRLTQLFENVFRNSIKHGGNTVTISVGVLPDGFYIADNGAGIAAIDREHIFERGFSTARGGTGLGLAIVAQIADAHGWNIELTDVETGGVRLELTGVEFVLTESDSRDSPNYESTK